MRLAIVSERTTPRLLAGQAPGGGHARQVAELATALATAGHDVRVYARADGSRADRLPRDVPIEHVPARAGEPPPGEPPPGEPPPGEVRLAAARSFGHALATAWGGGWAPDLVHAYYWLGGLAAVTASRRARIRIALTYHELGAGRRRPPDSGRGHPDTRAGWEQRLGGAVDRVITQSRAETEALVRLGVSRQRITMIPAGVDATRFAPTGPVAARGPAPRRIVTVAGGGKLDERKGVVDVIRALGRVPGAELVVVGGPPDRELAGDPQVASLRAVSARCGVAERVRFVGAVPRDEMPRWYRSADLVVCASWYEPVSLAPLEAMASGVPVVATAVGAFQDTIVDGLTGVLVPPHDPAALARAMRGVLADPILRMGYAAAALDRARQCYAWERVTRRLAAEYAQLCPSPPG
jgi:glycosyltransferase involved in cell wall biosynthesis